MSSLLGTDQPHALVAGAGGFIGGHLVARLLAEGQRVTAVDVKPLDRWYQLHPKALNLSADLALREACQEVADGVDEIYNLAADMGGIGFIENNKAACMLSVLINTHLLLAARDRGVGRYFYASSACVYPAYRQGSARVEALCEDMAYPAEPEDGYGWEKLFAERMGRHFAEDFGLTVRIARFHNVYGPYGSWDDGREKAPAALCRKVAEAVRDGREEIEVWGDGTRTRSFMYVDDCIEGIRRIMRSDVEQPLNLGTSELITVGDLARLVARTAGVRLRHRYDTAAPQGVHGRNSDNTLIRAALGWAPGVPLAEGLRPTYAWIAAQVDAAAPVPSTTLGA
ncbi:NAD-dependent epimerase/dehydratase family protein [Streptomyces sp. NBC_00006]|uniref:NAD-dependent epimerase/dehydratase family protein n=1 Tax=unclassified Streptomyces TaxID=2593676 RepID=UPI002256A538|nr:MULTISPECIES: NAD-dependent epimerase/dehydratase family protein [unclassified Streptomyces]MCX4834564.1 NAD-dependent epimerase/dehydratase family protein [Streptomyces sp. NBC_01016]MCX5529613.1 NAD-dependent epimerase/dehydratase family protein [Streptomyces sp. NBC_00006]